MGPINCFRAPVTKRAAQVPKNGQTNKHKIRTRLLKNIWMKMKSTYSSKAFMVEGSAQYSNGFGGFFGTNSAFCMCSLTASGSLTFGSEGAEDTPVSYSVTLFL